MQPPTSFSKNLHVLRMNQMTANLLFDRQVLNLRSDSVKNVKGVNELIDEFNELKPTSRLYVDGVQRVLL